MNNDDQSALPQIPQPIVADPYQVPEPTQPAPQPVTATQQGGSSDELVITPDMASLQSKVGAMPAEASDLDIIEKEWVVQLKNVVQHTAQDPYTQQAEISKVKADYMKKRYNKDIKVTGS